jgi:hypothetical protein
MVVTKTAIRQYSRILSSIIPQCKRDDNLSACTQKKYQKAPHKYTKYHTTDVPTTTAKNKF